MNFINEKSELLSITNDSKFVNYHNDNLIVTNLHYFTPTECKLETSDYIIKFSKGELNIYNQSKDRSLLDTFTFKSYAKNSGTSEVTVSSFELKKGYTIELKKGDTGYTIVNNGSVEIVTGIMEVGSWKVYTTTGLRQLSVSNTKGVHHKWCGIPIGEL